MIYLFEDRKDRMHQYLKEVVASVNLKEALFDCPLTMDIEEYVVTAFGDAKAILFHSSYKLASKSLTKEDVKASFLKKSIPFVFFSGGLENNFNEINGVPQAWVNHGDMYKNLSKFVEKFDNTGEVIIPILLYGSDYLLNDMLRFQKLTARYFSSQNPDYILSDEDIDILSNKIIEETLKNNEFSGFKQGFIDWLIDKQNSKSLYEVKTRFNEFKKEFQV